MDEKISERRSFFVLCFKALAAVGIGGFLYSLIKFMSRGEVALDTYNSKAAGITKSSAENAFSKSESGGASHWGKGTIEIDADSIPPGGARIVAVESTPVIVVHQDDGFVAFEATCTHLGCLVKWDENANMFVCPCHGGTYDKEGIVLTGPPPRNLTRCNIMAGAGKLAISLA